MLYLSVQQYSAPRVLIAQRYDRGDDGCIDSNATFIPSHRREAISVQAPDEHTSSTEDSVVSIDFAQP